MWSSRRPVAQSAARSRSSHGDRPRSGTPDPGRDRHPRRRIRGGWRGLRRAGGQHRGPDLRPRAGRGDPRLGYGPVADREQPGSQLHGPRPSPSQRRGGARLGLRGHGRPGRAQARPPDDEPRPPVTPPRSRRPDRGRCPPRPRRRAGGPAPVRIAESVVIGRGRGRRDQPVRGADRDDRTDAVRAFVRRPETDPHLGRVGAPRDGAARHVSDVELQAGADVPTLDGVGGHDRRARRVRAEPSDLIPRQARRRSVVQQVQGRLLRAVLDRQADPARRSHRLDA